MAGSKGMLDAGFKQILAQNAGALAGVHGALVSAAENRALRTILVTSCHPGEGKTVTAVGIAYSLSAQANAQVLLIDGNFSNSDLHRHFGVPGEPGLAEFLAGSADLDDVVCLTDEPRLKLLPLGRSEGPLFDVGRGRDSAQRLAALREKFDYVICDGRPVFGATDALAGAAYFDGIVLVVECERTRWEVVQDAKERVTKAGGKIVGVVLNKRRYYIPKALYVAAG